MKIKRGSFGGHGQEVGGVQFWKLLERSLLITVFAFFLAVGLGGEAFLSSEKEWVGPLLLPLSLGFGCLLAVRMHLFGGGAVAFVSSILSGYYAIAEKGIFEDMDGIARLWLAGGIVTLFTFTVTGFGLFVGYTQRGRDFLESRLRLKGEILNALPIGIKVRGQAGESSLVNDRWRTLTDKIFIREDGQSQDKLRSEFESIWMKEIQAILDSDKSGIQSTNVGLSEKSKELHNLTLLTSKLYIDPILKEGTLSLLLDETSLRCFEEEVETSNSRLQSALTNAEMGIWDQKLQSGEIYCDDNWYSILQVVSDGSMGPFAIWKERLHLDDRERVLSAYDDFYKKGDELIQVDYRIRRGDREYIWVQDRLRVIERNANGEAVRVMGTMQNISDRKRVEIDLKEAKEKAEVGSEAKGYFIATVSHEIRTPLNAIIGLSSFLAEGALNDEQQDLANTIHSSGKSLLLLVNDILDFSKVEAGRMDLVAEEFPLTLCFEECIKLFKLRARENSLELNLSMEMSLPEFALGDLERLKQIMQNLIANAIKFTERGEVEVIVRRAHLDLLPNDVRPNPDEPVGFLDEPDHDYLEVLVRDTGIGIPINRQGVLFDAFTQGDASTTRKYGGTGLGLAICKRLVSAMGGRIWLDSHLGQGSVFGFVIRTKLVREDESIDRFTRSPFGLVQHISEQHPCDILVVGSDQSIEVVLSSCRKLGYAPHHAPTYDLSSRAYKRRHYNVVFVSMLDQGGSFSVSRQMSSSVGVEQPDAIIGMQAPDSSISAKQAALNGITSLSPFNLSTAQVRRFILDSLGLRG